MVRISCLKMARKFCTGFFYTNDSCLSWWILEKFPWTSLGRTSFVLCTITIGKWGCTGDLIKMQLDMPICFPKCWVYLCLDTFFMSSWVNVVMFWLRRLHALKPLWFPIKSFFLCPKAHELRIAVLQRVQQKQGFPPVSPSRDRFKTLMCLWSRERKRWTRHKSRFDVGGIRPLNFWVQSFMNVRSQWLS